MKTELEDELFQDIGGNVTTLQKMIQVYVNGKRDLAAQHRAEMFEYESQMVAFLWRCRKLLTTVKIASLIGLSRQRLYEKWQKHGYNPEEETQ